MRYYVVLDAKSDASPILVDVTELPTGALEVRVGGRTAEVDVVHFGRQLSVRVDGRMVDLTTEGVPPELGAVANGHRSYVRVESERQRVAEAAKKVAKNDREKAVKSPMPGRIIKTFVQAGVTVASGDPLFVIEAMKMENEIKAKGQGKIVKVHVSIGDAVEGNQVLLTFE